MKSILSLLIVTFGSASISFAETNIYVEKTCTQTVTVDAVCAGTVDLPNDWGAPGYDDPGFYPEFVYLSQESFIKVKSLGLNPRTIKDAYDVCDKLDGYPIFMLFGDDAIPQQEIDFETVDVEFIKDCE